jgi:hypothetical protein
LESTGYMVAWAIVALAQTIRDQRRPVIDEAKDRDAA